MMAHYIRSSVEQLLETRVSALSTRNPYSSSNTSWDEVILQFQPGLADNVIKQEVDSSQMELPDQNLPPKKRKLDSQEELEDEPEKNSPSNNLPDTEQSFTQPEANPKNGSEISKS
jgi:hypothetical protein